jgi:hypothetical protein
MSDKLSELFAARMADKLSSAMLYGTLTTSTAVAPASRAFAMADLQRAFDLLKAARPPMWYTTTKFIDRGHLYIVPEMKLLWGSTPELHVFHEDFEAAFLEAYPHAKRWQRVTDEEQAEQVED